jgi:hypothetical protein
MTVFGRARSLRDERASRVEGRTRTGVWVLLAWTILCAIVFVVLAAAGASNEEHCRATGDYLCFDPAVVFGLVIAAGAVVWLVGILVIWIASRFVGRHR